MPLSCLMNILCVVCKHYIVHPEIVNNIPLSIDIFWLYQYEKFQSDT